MLRWAVIGTGNMAGQFLQDVAQIVNGRFSAVYSHSLVRAQAFAETHALTAAYDDYEQLLADPKIDAVYIASTPNNKQKQVNYRRCQHTFTNYRQFGCAI